MWKHRDPIFLAPASCLQGWPSVDWMGALMLQVPPLAIPVPTQSFKHLVPSLKLAGSWRRALRVLKPLAVSSTQFWNLIPIIVNWKASSPLMWSFRATWHNMIATSHMRLLKLQGIKMHYTKKLSFSVTLATCQMLTSHTWLVLLYWKMHV